MGRLLTSLMMCNSPVMRLALALALSAVAFGAEAFETVSIKPSSTAGGGLRITPDTLTAGRMNLRQLITFAYSVRYFQVSGGPAWVETERFDVTGKASGPASREQLLLMLRAALVERFGLAVHTEPTEMRVYALTVNKDGSKLRRAAEANEPPCTECRLRHARVSELAEVLTALVGIEHPDTPVIDQTGLDGFYDIAFHVDPDSDVFSSLAAQLGLRLDARKLPVDMLRIDRAGRPAAN